MSGYHSRRQLLGLMALTAFSSLSAWLGNSAAAARPMMVPALPSANRLTSVIDSPNSAGTIGRSYLAAYPEDADARRLERLLVDQLMDHQWRPDINRDDRLAICFEEIFRKDFATDDIVRVNGWFLARSEARLYALCALNQRADAKR